MFKKTLKILFILLGVLLVPKSVINLKAVNDNNSYYPAGVNYLDPENFNASPVNNVFSASSKNKFRIKPATTYCLASQFSDLLQIGRFEFQFYNYDGEDLELTPVYEYDTLFGNIISILFETPPSGHFIDIFIEINCPNPKEISTFSIDTYFIFFEGEIMPGGDSTYQGPNNLYPLINYEEAYYYTSYSDNISVEELKKSLYAFDDVDGDVTDRIIISEDDYTVNSGIIGTYPVGFSVSDTSGNVAAFIINIAVRDWDVPIISGPDVLETEPNQILTEEYLLSKLSAYDDYDGLLTSDIEVTSNGYLENHNNKGIYQVEFQVNDSSGNIGVHTINIDVKDRTAPVISGPAVITKPNNTMMSLSQIVLQYRAEDNIDGNITDMIEVTADNYSLHPNRVGTHTITLSVSDYEGNTTTLTVSVEVYDATAPVFMIDINKITVNIEEGGIMLRDLITQLEALGKNNICGVIEIINDEYSGNEKTPGIYGVVFKADDEYHKLEITVNAKEALPPAVKTGWLKKIGGFFKAIWASLRRFVNNYL
ncbi:MAG: hypothetical protein PHV87_03280 [Bacilli bacterium]|nr:hypothetical protein [Bacilli bacterium]